MHTRVLTPFSCGLTGHKSKHGPCCPWGALGGQLWPDMSGRRCDFAAPFPSVTPLLLLCRPTLPTLTLCSPATTCRVTWLQPTSADRSWSRGLGAAWNSVGWAAVLQDRALTRVCDCPGGSQGV